MLTDLMRRLRALLRPAILERDLDDELRFHLQHAIDRHRQAGLSLEEATRRARIDLGGLEQVKEACRDERGISVVDRLRQDVRFGLRVVRKSPAFSATVIATLALGIGATTTAFGVVDGILLKPLPYPNADRLVQIGTSFGSISVSAMSTPDLFDVATRAKTLVGAGGARTRMMDVTGRGAPERVTAAAATASFFDVLGVAPELGGIFGRDSDRRGADPVVVLSYGFWRRRFAGDRAAIGQRLTLDGVPHTIVGVMPALFRGPEALSRIESALWVPLGTVRGAIDDRDDAAWGVVARLAPGATVQQAGAELDVVGEAIGREVPGAGRRRFWLGPLRDRTVGDTGRQLWLLFGAVSTLLVVACANIAGLFLVRASGRSREMAVRVTMGASRGRIVRQLLAESALLSGAGGALGIAIAAAAIGAVRASAPADLPRLQDVGLDMRVLVFSLGATALAGLLFGLAPAVDAGRASLAAVLRNAAAPVTGSRSRTRLQSALVVVQISLALVLVVGASLLVRSLVRLSRVDPGFETRDIVWLDVTLPARYADAAARLVFFDDVLPAARALTGVSAVGLVGGRPLGGGNAVATMQPVDRPPADGNDVPRIPFHVVTPGYFSAMGIPLADGRDLRDEDRSTSARVAVVSRSFAERFWPGQRAIGRQFWMGRVGPGAPAIGVVGVVEDVLQYGLARDAEPIVYRPVAQVPVPRSTLSIVVRHDGRNPGQVLEQLRTAIWRLDPALPLDRGGTMEAVVRDSIGEPRFRALALSTFAAIAAFVAGVGLYGTLAWAIRARRRELGIRIVMGADARTIRWIVLRRGMRLTFVGGIIGTAAAVASSRALGSLVFGITTTDAATFMAALAAMAAVAAIACWAPARRAAAVDPVDTLRAE